MSRQEDERWRLLNILGNDSKIGKRTDNPKAWILLKIVLKMYETVASV